MKAPNLPANAMLLMVIKKINQEKNNTGRLIICSIFGHKEAYADEVMK